MAKIISKIDTKIEIPPRFKGLSGKDWVEIKFTANEPTEVSDKIAEYYTKNRSKVFRYAGEKEAPLGKQDDDKDATIEFNASEFFETNFDNIEQAIEGLEDRKKLMAICKVLGLSGFERQSPTRIKERIIQDIKVKKELEAKLANKKDDKE